MATASAARAESVEWLNQAPGIAMNPDGAYGLQCVDGADQYAQDLFGVPWRQTLGAVAGARQLMQTASTEYFEKVWNDPNNLSLIPQTGDIIIWNGSPINQWGHVAIVVSATQQGVTVVQQDGFAEPHQFVDGAWYSNKPMHIATLGYNNPGTGPVSGWLRPRPEKVKDTGAETRLKPQPKPDIKPNPVPQITPQKVMHGADVASHQRGIDFSKISADFVFVKITGGVDYVNPEAAQQISSARRSGKLVGLYHYAAEYDKRSPAKAEAEHFLKHATPLLDATTTLVLDWESKAVIGEGGNVWARDFLNIIADRTKRTPIFYGYKNAIDAHVWATVGKKFPLWFAWYGTENEMHGYATDFRLPFTVPAGFTLIAWQYTQNGRLPGYSAALDLNVFFGDESAWKQLASGGGIPKPFNPGVVESANASNTNVKPAPADVKPQSNGLVVLVERGDTLTTIAAQFATTVEKIIAANPALKKNPNRIEIGQQLVIPGAGVTQCVVEPGDSLSTIAAQFGTTVDALRKANPQLTDPNRIEPGWVLNLPGAAPRVTQVRVEAGDSLTSIAAQFGTTVQSIVSKNPGIDPNVIHPGQTLNI